MPKYIIKVTQTNEWVEDEANSRDEAAKAAYEAIWDDTTGRYGFAVDIKEFHRLEHTTTSTIEGPLPKEDWYKLENGLPYTFSVEKEENSE